jgi:hypothetical protein
MPSRTCINNYRVLGRIALLDIGTRASPGCIARIDRADLTRVVDEKGEDMRFGHLAAFVFGIAALWLLAPHGYVDSWLNNRSAYEKELESRIQSQLDRPSNARSEHDAAEAKRMLVKLKTENAQAANERGRYRLFATIAVSVVMGGLALWIIQKPRLRKDGFQWAYGALGVLVGYWLK